MAGRPPLAILSGIIKSPYDSEDMPLSPAHKVTLKVLKAVEASRRLTVISASMNQLHCNLPKIMNSGR